MNKSDRLELSKGLASAMRPQFENQLNRALYRLVGDQVVMIDDDLSSYVDDAFMFNPDVYSIVSMVARNFGRIPWVLHEVKDRKSYRKYKQANHEIKMGVHGTNIQRKAFEEVEDHKVLDILHRPNPYQGGSEFFENLMGFKMVTGNSYVYGAGPKTGPNAGQFHELWIMPSQYVEIESQGYMQPVRSYKLLNVPDQHIPAERVLHWKYWSPDYSAPGSHLYGLSPLRAARRVVTQSNDAYTTNMKLLQNSGAIGILQVDSEGQFGKPEAERLQSKYHSKFGGPHNAGKIVIAPGKFSWVRMGMTSVDMNLIESQKMSLRDLCNIFGVDSTLLNDPDNKVQANAKESRKKLYMEKLLPEMDSIKDELNRWFIPAFSKTDNREYYLDYDISMIPALADDIETMFTRVKDAWWLTPNERRVATTYDMINEPTMDKIYIPSSLKAIDAPAQPNPITGLMPGGAEPFEEGDTDSPESITDQVDDQTPDE